MKPNVQSPRDFLLIAVIVSVMFGLLSCASDGYSATVCRTKACAQRVIHKAAVVQAVAPVYYQVGAYLQQQAADTHNFRQSAEYQEYLQLKGFEAGVAAMLRRGEMLIEPPPVSDRPAPREATDPAAAPAPVYPTLAAHCAKCHSGETPKGEVWLDGSVDLRVPEAAEKRDAIVRALWTGTMPKNKPASDEVVNGIFNEIYAE